jgi:hypothetical protein
VGRDYEPVDPREVANTCVVEIVLDQVTGKENVALDR